MEVCKGDGPERPAGRSMHGIAKRQRCGALSAFDGYCVVHLKQRGYTRCPACGAWREPAGHRGQSVPVCDVCSSMGGPAPRPTLPLVGNLVEEGLAGLDREDGDGSQASYRALQPLDARAHAGDGDGAAREAGAYNGPTCGFALYGPPALCTCGKCREVYRNEDPP